MTRNAIKRQVDLETISDWIEPNSRVLDLGCGRGVLLEHLKTARNAYTVGVDTDPRKILSCVKRGVSAYQGDIEATLKLFDDGFFDWVICSRTLQDLGRPAPIIRDALRVGKHLAMGFVNHAYWLNRWHMLRAGSRIRNEVFPHAWQDSHPINPISVRDFEQFCHDEKIAINRHLYLSGNWQTPCRVQPNLFAGYVVYDLSR